MSVSREIQVQSSFWSQLNYAKVRFDIDFVTSNVIDMDIDGVAISSVTFDTDQLTTMAALISAINDTGLARSALDSEDTINRTVIVYGLGSSLVSVSDVLVTGGATQPVATIVPSIYNDLVTSAQCFVNTQSGCPCTDQATALVIMHWLTAQANSAGAGNAQQGFVKQKREGDLLISYGSTFSLSSSVNYSVSDSYWATTFYGSQYLVLRRQCIIPARNRMLGQSLY